MLCVLRRIPSSEWRVKPPVGFQLRQIDRTLLSETLLKNADLVAREIRSCWNSLDDFLTRGFGYSVLSGEEIVCWCTAEYMSNRKCGIGIETLEEYQGRGLATSAASAFVEHAVMRGITPYWDSWCENAASLAVARKIGFEELTRYSVYLGRA